MYKIYIASIYTTKFSYSSSQFGLIKRCFYFAHLDEIYLRYLNNLVKTDRVILEKGRNNKIETIQYVRFIGIVFFNFFKLSTFKFMNFIVFTMLGN